jgi:hypothetical protein
MPYLLDKIIKALNGECSGSQHVGGCVSIYLKLLINASAQGFTTYEFHVARRGPAGEMRRHNIENILFFRRLTDFLLQNSLFCSKYEY